VDSSGAAASGDRRGGDGWGDTQRLVPRAGSVPSRTDAWKQDAIAGLGEPRAASAAEAREDRRRVKELERQLHRKDKALAETAALPVLGRALGSSGWVRPGSSDLRKDFPRHSPRSGSAFGLDLVQLLGLLFRDELIRARNRIAVPIDPKSVDKSLRNLPSVRFVGEQ
jgi:hypothetical protein